MTETKIRNHHDARRWRQGCGDRVVFTNGVFDLLHPGHVSLLERARALGDVLIVGLNTDASAARLGKGSGRPVMPAEDRARVVAALETVDCVVLFDEDTPEQLITLLQPDVLVKGADYDPATLPGADVVRARGGEVHVLPLLDGYSTTAIVERLHVPT